MHNLIFSNFALHVNLDAAEIELVKAKLQYQKVKKSKTLLHSGDVSRHVYFVDSGCLRVYNTDKEGGEHNILFCPENWWATDIAGFSAQIPAFYTISALEDTGVFYFTYQGLEQLYTEVPKMERFFRILVQNGFSLYQRRMTANLSKSAEEHYELFHRLYPGLEQRIAQKQIASYLGITPVFLSMIRKRITQPRGSR